MSGRFLAILVCGAVGMFACTLYRKKKYSLSVLQCFLFTVLLTLTGVAGAKLLFAIENGFRAWDGVSFFGSVFLIPIVMPLIGFLFRLRPNQTLDVCGPCVAVMIACLRVNCFVAGCCGGWEVCIGSLCFAWPTQIIDSFWDLLIMERMMVREKKVPSDGKLYPMFMVGYSLMRFFLEFLRDTPKDWLLLSHGQWFSLAALLVGGVWLLLLKRRCAEQ